MNGFIRPLSHVALLGMLALPTSSLAQDGFSEHARSFIMVCLQHAPGLSEAAISRSVSQERFNARGSSATASVAVRDGRSCNLRIGGGETGMTPPSDQETQRLALWFAGRVGGNVTRQRSAIGGSIWYKVQVGRMKYGVEATLDKGVLSYWIAKR
ncbi:hypothetical protein [Aliiroseovarius crassostreae]|uniref:hypothetical protein n=1 Tax=Aliiroseovarius crassostreae TaxID=154981 RepID=UPI003C7CF7FC